MAKRVPLALRFYKKFEKWFEGHLNSIALQICKQRLSIKKKKVKEKYFFYINLLLEDLLETNQKNTEKEKAQRT